MIDKGVNALGRVVFIFPTREDADSTKKYGERNMWGEMIRADKRSLDIGGFVFVFHIVESRQNSLLPYLWERH